MGSRAFRRLVVAVATTLFVRLVGADATGELRLAFGALQAAVSASETGSTKCSIAIWDVANAGVKAFLREDGAPPGTVDLAIGRARTNAHYGAENPFLLPNYTFPGATGYSFQESAQGLFFTGPGVRFVRPQTTEAEPAPSAMSVGVACGGTTWAEVADASQAVADAAADALNHFARADTVTAATSVAVVGSLITLNQVTGMLSAAVLNASSSDIRGVFSVVDASGILKAVAVMDGAFVGWCAASGSIETKTTGLLFPVRPSSVLVNSATAKARAVRLFDLFPPLGSDALGGKTSAPLGGNGNAYGVEHSNGGLVTIVGGHLISDGTRESTIGAIGISGVGPAFATALGDIACAAVPRPLGPFTLRERRGVTAREAQEAARIAFKAAAGSGSGTGAARPVAVAVTDAGGQLRALYVQDGANRGAGDIALRAAWTASLFHADTAVLGSLTTPPGPLFGLENLGLSARPPVSGFLAGGLVTFPGGIVIRDEDGRVLGAVGVSSAVITDEAIAGDAATAALAANATSATEPGSCATAVDFCADFDEVNHPPVLEDLSASSLAVSESISLAQAVGMLTDFVDFALRKGAKGPEAGCAAVADGSDMLRAVLCLDDAFLGAADLSVRKGRASMLFGVANGDLQAAEEPGGAAYGLGLTNGGIFTNPGGVPVLDSDGRPVGAVGVAGLSADMPGATHMSSRWVPAKSAPPPRKSTHLSTFAWGAVFGTFLSALMIGCVSNFRNWRAQAPREGVSAAAAAPAAAVGTAVGLAAGAVAGVFGAISATGGSARGGRPGYQSLLDEHAGDEDYAPLRAAPQLSPRGGPPPQRSHTAGGAAGVAGANAAPDPSLLPVSMPSPLAGFSHLTEGPEIGFSAGGSDLVESSDDEEAAVGAGGSSSK